MHFGQLPRAAQVYFAGVLSLSALALALVVSQPAAQAPVDLFVLLVAAAAVAHSFPVSTGGKQAYHVSLPFLVAAIIVLSPQQMVALIVVIHVAEWLRRRRSTFAQVFNVAAYTVAALVAQSAYRLMWPAQGELIADLTQPACLAAGVVAATMFALLNRILVSVAIWLAHRISPRNQRIFEAEGLLTDAVLLLMGVPMAHLLLVAPWAAAVGAAPLVLMYRVLDLPNMRAKSRQDGLTELFSAPYLTEACARELNRARRFNQPVTLLLVDLDGLGELNARHGHQAGDAMLVGTARAVNNSKREYDLAARLSGGLFAVLLPDTDLAQAQAVAERIRRGAADGRYEIPSSIEQTRLTVSIGGAVLSGGDASPAMLFEAAESALAGAKRDGGNQIEFVFVQPTSTLAAAPADVEGEALTLTPVASSPPSADGTQGSGRAPDLEALRPSEAVGRGKWEARGFVLIGLGAVALGGALLWSTATLDWRRLLVLTVLAVVAGLAFTFKPLTVALAVDVQRSPRRWVAHCRRLWPMYLALALTGFLVAYGYYRFGLVGALTMSGAALLFRHLARRYVDRTFASVRKLRVVNQQLAHQAFHDALTGLANRALFGERLEHAMVRASDGSIAVLFVDLDNFKAVNDTLGHAIGDALLVAATARLLTCVRREDTIARLGGDEFTVLLEDMRDPSDAARMAERIGEALRTPFDLDGNVVVISCSIGVALDTDRSHAPDDLLREADMAMYRAKSAGKARYEIFDTGMGSRATRRLELEAELRSAVDQDELVVDYQPIVDLATGAVDAVEARLRWAHPRRGLLDAVEFWGVAEQAGMVLDVGRWALYQACRDGVRWQAARPGLVVQVHLSLAELAQPAFVGVVTGALAASGLPAMSLMLEIPESAVATHGEAISGVLDDLRGVGVWLALDEVGAGVASVAWLSRLPIDVLKLAASATQSPALVRATVALGAALGMPVNACGVDLVDQAASLALFGCRQAQGSLYGGPQSARSIDDQLPAVGGEVSDARARAA